jgi:hypothetical protein
VREMGVEVKLRVCPPRVPLKLDSLTNLRDLLTLLLRALEGAEAGGTGRSCADDCDSKLLG